MQPDKEFIERKVAEFRAKVQSAHPDDNVAEPTQAAIDRANEAGSQSPPAASEGSGSDESAGDSETESSDDIARVLANVVQLKC